MHGNHEYVFFSSSSYLHSEESGPLSATSSGGGVDDRGEASEVAPTASSSASGMASKSTGTKTPSAGGTVFNSDFFEHVQKNRYRWSPQRRTTTVCGDVMTESTQIYIPTSQQPQISLIRSNRSTLVI